MNPKEVVAQLEAEFPGKNILQLPPENPTEIVCEVEPTTVDHPERSVAVAVIDRSAQHVHRISTETYEIEDGEVTLSTNGKKRIMKKGDSWVIQPGEIHRADANGARVKVTSEPVWTPEDHILIPGVRNR